MHTVLTHEVDLETGEVVQRLRYEPDPGDKVMDAEKWDLVKDITERSHDESSVLFLLLIINYFATLSRFLHIGGVETSKSPLFSSESTDTLVSIDQAQGKHNFADYAMNWFTTYSKPNVATAIRFHTTVLSDLYDQTHDIKATQDAAGHTTADMTLKYYVKGRSSVADTASTIDQVYGTVSNW